jgi:pyruvate/2-oxoglutarate dehydrogenase complex dihydrolipoamide acyltransferase (E2) component
VSSSLTDSDPATHPHHPATDPQHLVDVTMPQMGVSVAEGTIVAWRVAVGDRIEAEQTVLEISTDKIDSEVPAPVSGTLAEILVAPDTTVDVGTVLGRIATGDVSAEALPAPTPNVPAETSPAPAAPENRGYSPVVQRIAAEHEIDLSSVTGSGRGGRVRKQDVLALINGNGSPPALPTPPAPVPPPEPPMHIESPYRPDPDVPTRPRTPVATSPEGLSRMRRTIGQRMKQSLDTAATCTTWIEVDMSRVEAARAALGVTALAFVARATVQTLREFPALNAWLNGEMYSRVDDVNLGIAVSLGEDGLIVPVIHRAQELSTEGLAARIRDVAKRARAGELTADDVLGGTFTITNPGQYGSIMATPVINQPQVAILDFEATVKRPVVIDDAIAIRPITILGMSWDHRALDGVLAAQFLASLRERLESVT